MILLEDSLLNYKDYKNSGTNQRDDESEEPGVDEEVISTDLDDVEEQGGHRQQNTLSHRKLLQGVLQEEP